MQCQWFFFPFLFFSSRCPLLIFYFLLLSLRFYNAETWITQTVVRSAIGILQQTALASSLFNINRMGYWNTRPTLELAYLCKSAESSSLTNFHWVKPANDLYNIAKTAQTNHDPKTSRGQLSFATRVLQALSLDWTTAMEFVCVRS